MANQYLVGSNDNKVVIGRLKRIHTAEEAFNLAAWLVLIGNTIDPTLNLEAVLDKERPK